MEIEDRMDHWEFLVHLEHLVTLDPRDHEDIGSAIAESGKNVVLKAAVLLFSRALREKWETWVTLDPKENL